MRIERREFLSRLCAGEREFSGANLRGIDLRDSRVEGVRLEGADLTEARLSRASFRKAFMKDAVLDGAELVGTFLGDAFLYGARLESANLTDAELPAVNLKRADLNRVVACRAEFRNAFLQGAKARGADLSDANLKGADLERADFSEALLRGGRLVGAVLEGTTLAGADLRGVAVRGCRGRPSDIRGLLLDAETYRRSGWQPDEFSGWLNRGADCPDIDELPLEVRVLVVGDRLGLSLVFDKRVTAFDRFLLDGLVFGVLGSDTDCRVVAFEESGESATVRLAASSEGELIAVAEALWERVWKHTGSVQSTDSGAKLIATNARLSRAVVSLSEELTQMRNKLSHIELRQRVAHEHRESIAEETNASLAPIRAAQRTAAVAEAEARRAERENLKYDIALTRTWGQDLARSVAEEAKARVLRSTKKLAFGPLDKVVDSLMLEDD